MAPTDITNPKWFIPLSLKARAFAHLMRLDRPIGTWLLLLPGWWGIALTDWHRWDLFILFAVGAIVMRGAGCIINDLWDQDLDAAVERTRTRPLVTGAVTRQEAFALLFFLMCVGTSILLYMPIMTLGIGMLAMAFVISYPLMKRITWWPQFFLGLTFNFGALLGWAATTAGLAPGALWLYAGGIFWTLGYDTIYAHQDKEDDALAGIKSTARLFGIHSKAWVSVFYAIALALWWQAIPTPFMVWPAMHFIWQVWQWDLDDPASSLAFFKSNRNAGLLVLVAIATEIFLSL